MSSALSANLVCSCGRAFAQHSALSNHQRSCRASKGRVVDALSKAKNMLQARKRRRLENESSDVSRFSITPLSDLVPEQDALTASHHHEFENTHLTNTMAIYADSTSKADDIVQICNERQEPYVNPDLPIAARRTRRNLSANEISKNIDILPQAQPSLPPSQHASLEAADGTHSLSPSEARVPTVFHSTRNVFRLSRKYFTTTLPLHDPEELITLEDLCCHPAPVQESANTTTIYHPYPNRSSFLLGDWYWNGGVQKSQESFTKLLRIIGDSTFNPIDIQYTKWSSINAALGNNEKDSDGEWLDADGGWSKTPIQISVPFHRRTKKPGAQLYVGGDLYHRSLMDIIKERITDPQAAQHFHLQPYELLWNMHHPKNSLDVRVHGELYNSPAFLDAHNKLQEAPGEPGCDLSRVVVALMFWSDATHLTSFGNAKIWPLYMFFGNESKYRRCQPTNNLCCHVAYFQDISDDFKDFVTVRNSGKGLSRQFYTHCRREFIHAQLKIILDEEFLKAYQHGVVIQCIDGIQRRFYPRMFTYSADYPEKILLASIRSKGGYPCPRCLIPKERIHNLGKIRDRQQRLTLQRTGNEALTSRISTARELIYSSKKNHAVNSEAVENRLKPQSLVPTSNAFFEKLVPLGVNPFAMFVVDLLHEVELGMWKNLFIHLLRILHAKDKNLVNELDRRFRLVPTFGRGTIRKFSKNTSEMKKLAARDFEDILQCAIPIFEGLLPKHHNNLVLRLIFLCAHWHGMAKLRLHTDITLDIMDKLTTELGQAFRDFRDKVCSVYETRELPRETAKRQRRAAKKVASQLHPEASGPDQTTNQPKRANKKSQQATGNPKTVDSPVPPKIPRRKGINLHTYKHHALGDYVDTIRKYGTTDSYSTETGELEHRSPKARYRRTDRKAFIKQLTQMERRSARIRRIKFQVKLSTGESQHQTPDNVKHPEQHHHIGKSEHLYEDIGTFLRIHQDDPAIKDFIPQLKEHILSRIKDILRQENPLAFSSRSQIPGSINLTPDSHQDQLDGILFKHNRLYTHNILRINYTTYDVRRSQDVINPRTPHCNIMVLATNSDSDADNHMFLYGRVLRIYHANIIYNGPGMLDHRPRRVEFLWVRWYDQLEPLGSWSSHKLDCLSFPPISRPGAFGFLNPADVIRGSHIIPAFAYNTKDDEGLGLISSISQRSEDWKVYYVNRFVDRDMLMRYHRGLGIGHIYPGKAHPVDVDETQAPPNPNDLPLLESGDEEGPPPCDNHVDSHLLNDDNMASDVEPPDQDVESSDEDEDVESSSDEESDDMSGEVSQGDSESDEVALEYDEMYGHVDDGYED